MDTTQDTTYISLLTCSPGQEVWSLYGHTALRVVRGEADLVFNYGIFSFSAPNFAWRFALGETDYRLAAYPLEHFLTDYRQRGSGVVEQRLALTQQEADDLVAYLVWNALPEKCTYRYNYLTENCTTRVRDAIFTAIKGNGGEVVTACTRSETYRQMMHAYTRPDHPWAELGNDIMLGAECDTLLSSEASLWLPEALEEAVESAVVVRQDGVQTPLLAQRDTLLVASPSGRSLKGSAPPSPFAVGVVFAIVCLASCLSRRVGRWVDAVSLALMGLVGAFVVFMFLCSQHPTLASNWQVLLFHPLWLLCLPWLRRTARLRVAYLALFLIASVFIDQDFCVLTLPLACGLLIRAIKVCTEKS